MKCHDVRRYMYAFTDGALEVKENLEILAHVNMCPNCAARVDADEQLKKRLHAVFAAETAPPALESRIRAALKRESAPRRASIILRFAPVLAAAAVIGLVAFVWMTVRPTPTENPVVASNDTKIEQPTAAAALASEFRAGHLKCSKIGPSHHLAGLARELPDMENQLSRRLGLAVVAPDWRHQELRFVSACTCGVPNGAEGAHLIYENPHVRAVSLYCLEPSDQFTAFDSQKVLGRSYRIAHSDGMNLVSWSGPTTDYLVCTNGEFGDSASLIETLIDPVRVAVGESADATDVKLAMADAVSMLQWTAKN